MYNGFKNYETWRTVLEINNDEHQQEYWKQWAMDYFLNQAKANPQFSKEEDTLFALAETLKDNMGETVDIVLEHGKVENSLIADLLLAAIGEIAWMEVARNIVEGILNEEEAA